MAVCDYKQVEVRARLCTSQMGWVGQGIVYFAYILYYSDYLR